MKKENCGILESELFLIGQLWRYSADFANNADLYTDFTIKTPTDAQMFIVI
jgi:hypothetical protein